MFGRINKRTIFLLLFILIFIIVIFINFILKSNDDKENYTRQLDFEQYLDNGIQLSEFLEKKEYLDNIEINQIKIKDGIEYTIKNNGNNEVYISNEIEILIGEDAILLSDSIDGKIKLEPNEEKIITIDSTINQLSQKLGYYIDIKKISIIKPIYVKYDENKLLGIVKGTYNE